MSTVDYTDATLAPSISASDAGLLLAAEVETNARSERRFGFKVCGIGLLVPVGVSSEVVTSVKISRLPWQIPFVRGMLNLRGNVVPVFDVSPLFPTAVRPPVSSEFIIALDSGPKAVCIVADTLPTSLTCHPIESAPPSSPLPTLLADHVRSSVSSSDETWFEIDHLAFFRQLAQQPLS